MNTRPKVGPILDADGVLHSDDAAMANRFSETFASAMRDNSAGLTPFSSVDKIGYINFTPDIVFKALCKVKRKLSCGYDSIPGIFLYNLANFLCIPLSTIFNISLMSSTLPSDWLKSKIIPVSKKGVSTKIANYRPVALTSNVCKVFESVINSNLMHYLLSKSIICKEQFGFLPGRSTETQLIKCVDDWSKSLNDNVPVDVVYFDISKAFDTLSHDILLKKCDSLGFSPYLLFWLKSYLCDRSQFVCVNNSSDSLPVRVTSGVPQGSILGPLLFLIYINDLPDVVKFSKIMLFADDAKIFCPIRTKNDHDMLISDCSNVMNWMSDNLLSLSTSKSCVLHLSSHFNPCYPCIVNGVSIDSVESVFDLGILIDRDLAFNSHISQVVRKCGVRLSVIRKNFHYRDRSFLIQLYKTFVRPLLEYATPVWSPHHLNDINLLESIQRRFTRAILPELPYVDRCRELGLMPLEQRRNVSDMILCFKFANNLVDVDSPFTNNARHSGRNRHCKVFDVQGACKDLRRNTFAVRAPKMWNNLSHDIVESRSSKSCRTMLISYFKSYHNLRGSAFR